MIDTCAPEPLPLLPPPVASASPPPLPPREDGLTEDDTAAGRFRRAVYCFVVAGVSMVSMMVVEMLRPDTELSRMTVSSFADLATTISVLYVGGSVLDHSNILGLIGRRIYRGPTQ